MRDPRTIEEKVSDWWEAYQPIRDTLTPEGFRALAALTSESVENLQAINIGLAVSRVIFDNDRTAATVAQAMTQYPSASGEDGP